MWKRDAAKVIYTFVELRELNIHAVPQMNGSNILWKCAIQANVFFTEMRHSNKEMRHSNLDGESPQYVAPTSQEMNTNKHDALHQSTA